MYPGSLPLIFNGSVPGHKTLFNVRRCSMYTGFNLAGSTIYQGVTFQREKCFFPPFRVPISSLSYNLSC